jgi:hypothetical protein
MAEIILNNKLNELKQFWSQQNIRSEGNNLEYINSYESKLNIILPQDFKIFFQYCNGMIDKYPNYSDEEGFLFYPIENIVTAKIEFSISPDMDKAFEGNQCVIFMNYLHKSWWYGILYDKPLTNPENYSIIIIPDHSRYKVICRTLAEFIDLYIKDSLMLYEY